VETDTLGLDLATLLARRLGSAREDAMDEITRTALDRLLTLADSDTGQSRRAANFILAWWNAETLGGFDLADLFAVDASSPRIWLAFSITWRRAAPASIPTIDALRSRRSSAAGIPRSGPARSPEPVPALVPRDPARLSCWPSGRLYARKSVVFEP
jgi:hypothetical protein